MHRAQQKMGRNFQNIELNNVNLMLFANEFQNETAQTLVSKFFFSQNHDFTFFFSIPHFLKSTVGIRIKIMKCGTEKTILG